MGSVDNEIASVEETIEQVEILAKQTGLTLCAVDNIIWSFCADGYGEICTATPRCEKCVVRGHCANTNALLQTNENFITYTEMRKICTDLNNDATEIGKYILKVIEVDI